MICANMATSTTAAKYMCGHASPTRLKSIYGISAVATIKFVSLLARALNATDTDIVMAIVARLPKAKRSSAFTLIYNTGMVSGEYGLANAHKFKKQEIEKKYLNSDNKKIREFAEDAVKLLDSSIKAEIQRTDERNRLERMEYEE